MTFSAAVGRIANTEVSGWVLRVGRRAVITAFGNAPTC